MATYFFHEEIQPSDDETATLVRYYYDDISADILTRSFHLIPHTGNKTFIDNELIPFADLRADLKTKLIQFLYRRTQAEPQVSS
jgi:hypothetical protein